MAIGTTAVGEGLRTGTHGGGILEVRGRAVVCMAANRCGANPDQRPVDDVRIRLICRNIKETTEEEDCRADGYDNGENTDASQDSHGRPSLWRNITALNALNMVGPYQITNSKPTNDLINRRKRLFH
jgi:hypothetical protein